jgi:hypothetical protein
MTAAVPLDADGRPLRWPDSAIVGILIDGDALTVPELAERAQAPEWLVGVALRRLFDASIIRRGGDAYQIVAQYAEWLHEGAPAQHRVPAVRVPTDPPPRPAA